MVTLQIPTIVILKKQPAEAVAELVIGMGIPVNVKVITRRQITLRRPVTEVVAAVNIGTGRLV